MAITHPYRELACLATAAYGDIGWSVSIVERDAHRAGDDHPAVPLVGEHFDAHYATRELSAHGWDVLGDPKPWGEWSERPDGSWTAYVDDERGCPRGCSVKVFGCRWPHRDALPECEDDS
jgi:hypothetical protein